MKKILLIIPFYGKVPDYFDIFTMSVKHNPSIDFLFVTDLNLDDYALPTNFKVENMSFDDLKNLIQSRFDFEIRCKTPYQLCDFRAAYALIFSEYIKEYDFWGHCDTDQVWGDMRKYLTEDRLNCFECLYYLGHLALFKNNEKINNFFKLPGALYDYKKVYSTDEWYSFGEVSGTLQIRLRNNISLYSDVDFADVKSSTTRLLFYGDKVNPKHFVFYWEDGRVKRAYITKDGCVKGDEWMYIHLQKRKMKDKRTVKGDAPFYITGKFYYDKSSKGTPSIEEIMRLSDYHGEWIERKEKAHYIIGKLKKFIGCSWVQKKIWWKQRVSRKNFLWPEVSLYK